MHVDGEGTVLTTTEVVLDPRRNPASSASEAERLLCEYLGAEKVLWLTAALDHDNTGGPRGQPRLLRRARASSWRSAAPTATTRSTRPSQENLARLRAATDARGRALEVVELPLPARPESRGRRLSPCYVNFYVANGGVVMPAFGDPADDAARDVLARLFPRRAVVAGPDAGAGQGRRQRPLHHAAAAGRLTRSVPSVGSGPGGQPRRLGPDRAVVLAEQEAPALARRASR